MSTMSTSPKALADATQRLTVTVSGGSNLSVRQFAVRETLSGLFTVHVWALSDDPSIELDGSVGQPATFRAISGYKFARLGGARYWTGICRFMEQVHSEPTGLSSYFIEIVPTLWVLSQRSNHRVFQRISGPDIVDTVLTEWGFEPKWKIDRGRHPKLDLRIQYGESDYDFICRLMEETGVTFHFPDDDEKGSLIELADEPQSAAARPGGALPFVDNPNQAAEIEFVSNVAVSREVRPGAQVIRDHDFRKPYFALDGQATGDVDSESRYEQYRYEPGAFLSEVSKGTETPAADDKGVSRHDPKFGAELAQRSLLAERMGHKGVSFDTNAIDLWPGMVMGISGHTHAELPESRPLLVTEFSIEGTHDNAWRMSGRAVFADGPFRPAQKTPRPKVIGVQSAVVVGPKMQEIHTDEFGRVRVQFPWDRDGKNDDDSLCWVRVNQGWAGAGYGMFTLPRVGQEVLVTFLDGSPDQPVVVGRLFNQVSAAPYRLPEFKTKSGWKSRSSPDGDGFNEILFEDKKSKELFSVQAERNLRRLVKNDETITVGKDRQKHVGANEQDTTVQNRTEVTGANRSETTGQNRTTVIGGNRGKLVKQHESVHIGEHRVVRTGGTSDKVTRKKKRERIEAESHLHVKGSARERVDGKRSLIVKDNDETRVEEKYALAAGKEIHLAGDEVVTIEAAGEITIKGPGGFVRIDEGGITIKGKSVNINAGGVAGSGSGADPDEPESAREPVFEVPKVLPGFELSAVDTDGEPLAGARVKVLQSGKEIMTATLDDEGRTWVTGYEEGKPCEVEVEGYGSLGQFGHIPPADSPGEPPEYDPGEAEDDDGGCGVDEGGEGGGAAEDE